MRRACCLIGISLLSSSCAQASDVPACFNAKLKDNTGLCADGASLVEYRFQNRTVYVLNPGNCGADMAAEVLDASCASLGALGGLMGNMEINGEAFDHAVKVKTVWQK